MSIESKEYTINNSDLVLDVGGGHNPFWRSDVIVELLPEDNSHRGEDINIGNRYLIEGDGINLPFRENSFDYIWLNHTIEHSQSPQIFCNELSRVGRRGYLGAPSEMYEILFNSHDYHLWILNIQDGELVACKKDENFIKSSNYFGELFGLLQDNSEIFYKFYRGHFNIFKVNINWENEINCNIKNAWPLFDYSNKKQLIDIIQNRKDYVPANHAKQKNQVTKNQLINKMISPITKSENLFEENNKIIDPDFGPIYQIINNKKFIRIESEK